MTIEILRSLLVDSHFVEVARIRSTGAYSAPIENVAAGVGIDRHEFRRLTCAGVDIAGVMVINEGDNPSSSLPEAPVAALASGMRSASATARYERGSSATRRDRANSSGSDMRTIPDNNAGPFATACGIKDLDAAAKYEWEFDAAIRAESPSVEAFRAHRRPDARGARPVKRKGFASGTIAALNAERQAAARRA